MFACFSREEKWKPCKSHADLGSEWGTPSTDRQWCRGISAWQRRAARWRNWPTWTRDSWSRDRLSAGGARHRCWRLRGWSAPWQQHSDASLHRTMWTLPLVAWQRDVTMTSTMSQTMTTMMTSRRLTGCCTRTGSGWSPARTITWYHHTQLSYTGCGKKYLLIFLVISEAIAENFELKFDTFITYSCSRKNAKEHSIIFN